MISVIIPTKCNDNRHGLSRLLLTLESLNNQSLPYHEYEVIIVDDGSDVNIEDELKKEEILFQYKVIKTKGLGMGSAYNIGVNQSNGSYIFLGLDDTIYSERTLEIHNTSLKQNNIVIGKETYINYLKIFKNPIDGVLDSRVSIDEVFGSFAKKVNVENWTLNKNDVKNERMLKMLSSIPSKVKDLQETLLQKQLYDIYWLAMRVGNHSLSKKLFKKINGFDENLDKGDSWYSDIDLGIKLYKEKTNFLFESEAVSYNLTHFKEIDYLKAENNYAYMMEKYPYLEIALIPMFFAYGPNYKLRDYLLGLKQIIEITKSKSLIKEVSNGYTVTSH